MILARCASLRRCFATPLIRGTSSCSSRLATTCWSTRPDHSKATRPDPPFGPYWSSVVTTGRATLRDQLIPPNSTSCGPGDLAHTHRVGADIRSPMRPAHTRRLLMDQPAKPILPNHPPTRRRSGRLAGPQRWRLPNAVRMLFPLPTTVQGQLHAGGSNLRPSDYESLPRRLWRLAQCRPPRSGPVCRPADTVPSCGVARGGMTNRMTVGAAFGHGQHPTTGGTHGASHRRRRHVLSRPRYRI